MSYNIISVYILDIMVGNFIRPTYILHLVNAHTKKKKKQFTIIYIIISEAPVNASILYTSKFYERRIFPFKVLLIILHRLPPLRAFFQ